jgi:hypothetical protein
MAVPSPAAQQQRLLDTGWDVAAAADMAAVYYGSSCSSSSSKGDPFKSSSACSSIASGVGVDWLRQHWQQDRKRIEGLELLDELEEWRLLQVGRAGGAGLTAAVPGIVLAPAVAAA